MRILVQMPFPGYLRNYGSTIRHLADRGHRVLLTYDAPQKRRDPHAAAIEAHEAIELVPPLPSPARPFEPAIAQLRLAADYIRYLDSRFAEAPYLRRRLEKYLRGPLRPLARLPVALPFAPSLVRALLAAERLVPSDPGLERALTAHAPEVVFVTPLIGRTMGARSQTDTVKAARKLGIPVAFGVATWDHLTTKGTVKALPDRVFVWNDLQRRDAAELHFVPDERIVVTGAQLFDAWFEQEPGSTCDDFLARVGLGSGRYVLYVGSSPNIAAPRKEIRFVQEWLGALRRSGDPTLEQLSVLVRPHPSSVEDWANVDLSALGGAVAPRTRPELPMSDEDDRFYFDSIHFSSVVVGINTTAMVESFVQRRPVLTVHAPEFRETQLGTLHFRQLVRAAGGALQSARSLDEHFDQLRNVLERPGSYSEAIDSFLLTFVRPHGLERPATEVLVDALEELAAVRPTSALPRRRVRAASVGV